VNNDGQPIALVCRIGLQDGSVHETGARRHRASRTKPRGMLFREIFSSTPTTCLVHHEFCYGCEISSVVRWVPNSDTLVFWPLLIFVRGPAVLPRTNVLFTAQRFGARG